MYVELFKDLQRVFQSNCTILHSTRKWALNAPQKDWCWGWHPNLWLPDVKSQPIGKDPDAGKDWGQEEKQATEAEMVGWHHRLDGHEWANEERVKDREAWRAAVHGVTKSWQDWATEQEFHCFESSPMPSIDSLFWLLQWICTSTFWWCIFFWEIYLGFLFFKRLFLF